MKLKLIPKSWASTLGKPRSLHKQVSKFLFYLEFFPAWWAGIFNSKYDYGWDCTLSKIIDHGELIFYRESVALFKYDDIYIEIWASGFPFAYGELYNLAFDVNNVIFQTDFCFILMDKNGELIKRYHPSVGVMWKLHQFLLKHAEEYENEGYNYGRS